MFPPVVLCRSGAGLCLGHVRSAVCPQLCGRRLYPRHHHQNFPRRPVRGLWLQQRSRQPLPWLRLPAGWVKLRPQARQGRDEPDDQDRLPLHQPHQVRESSCKDPRYLVMSHSELMVMSSARKKNALRVVRFFVLALSICASCFNLCLSYQI